MPGVHDHLEHRAGRDHPDQPDHVHWLQCGLLRPLLLSLHRPQAQGRGQAGRHCGENSLFCLKTSHTGIQGID